MEKEVKGITAKKEEDSPEWYSQVCLKSDLADYGTVKGTMIIKPAGFAIWQKITDLFNKQIEKLGVQNAYFPMFIPESFFKKEAEHAEGFAPEVAWIENKNEDSERLAVRPTSETIMYDSYSRWIRSWRDLPLRMNQWCNIVRWEVSDVKLFLRSREFLWQEGHCVYETEEECNTEALQYLEEYRKLAEDLLAVPVILGEKTDKERFPGAKRTYGIESFMPDGKALQCGTSHNLGQGFAKAFNISYIGKDEKKHTPWQNSWGFSTRLIGALVMMHSDNKGLVLPPKIAGTQVVIVPIIFEESKEAVMKQAKDLKTKIRKSFIDDREGYSAGFKFNEWELKGIPIRIEIGPKDLEKKQAVLVRRDTHKKEFVKLKDVEKRVEELLDEIQDSLFIKAQKFIKASMSEVSNWKEFEKVVLNKKMALAPFCGEIECEEYIKDKTKGAGSRLIPFEQKKISGNCVHCKEKAKFWTVFSKAY